MMKLGQRLLQTEDAALTQLDREVMEHRASEATRIAALQEAFRNVLTKARNDIAAGVLARLRYYEVGSKVHEDEHPDVYRFLRVKAGSATWCPDAPHLQPVWDAFLAWAHIEELGLELVSCLPDIVDGEQVGGSYVWIRTRLAD